MLISHAKLCISVIFVITLTLRVTECPVRALPFESLLLAYLGRERQGRSIQTMSGSISVVAVSTELKFMWDTVFCLN